MNRLPMKLLMTGLLGATAFAQSWVSQTSGSTASLRGVSAFNDKIVWASGTGGTYLASTDGGALWKAAKVPGAEGLDFRDIHVVDGRTVYLLSSGTGDKARIYKTVNGGTSWDLQVTNPDEKGFFDAMAFWDATHGIVVGDPVDGHFVIFTTADGGNHWQRQTTPAAVPNEGAFAASGTCLITMGKREAWFATGGPGGARVFHSADRGVTWTVTTTPVRNDAAAAGIFSIGFRDSKHGIVVGGDYTKPADTSKNFAVTSDGGRTWTTPTGAPPAGFRSAVTYLADRKAWIVTGTSGSDISSDDGKTWKNFDTGNYNAVSFISSKAGWAVGPRGHIASFRN